MGMLIFLLLVISLAVLLIRVFKDKDVLIAVNIIIIIVAIIWLIIHVICWSAASYNYKCFVARRNALEQTLHDCRATGNQYETATIVKEVSDWNGNLAKKKINLETFVLESYEVEEILTLKPIK